MASASLYASLGSYWRGSSGSVGGLSEEPADDDAEMEARHGTPEAHPQWPRFFSVWGGANGETRKLAESKWRASMRWRDAARMDDALCSPQPVFHLVKRSYAHCFHKRTRDGRVLVMERGDQFAALVAAFAEAELDPADAALHVAMLNEFLARELDTRCFPGGRVVRIFDCEELSTWDLGTNAVAFARAVTAVLGPNYPERISRVLVVNAPASFALAYSLMTPMLTRKLLDKVTLFSASQAEQAREALLELVAPENLPERYGGTCRCPGEGGCWRNSAEELALWRLVEKHTPPELRR